MIHSRMHLLLSRQGYWASFLTCWKDLGRMWGQQLGKVSTKRQECVRKWAAVKRVPSKTLLRNYLLMGLRYRWVLFIIKKWFSFLFFLTCSLLGHSLIVSFTSVFTLPSSTEFVMPGVLPHSLYLTGNPWLVALKELSEFSNRIPEPWFLMWSQIREWMRKSLLYNG